MFNWIFNIIVSIILGLFFVSLMWSIFGGSIKDMFQDIASIFRKKE